MNGRISGKQVGSSRGTTPHKPTSLNPGVSTRYPPVTSGIITADTVVFLPRRTLALISPIRSLSPGCTAFRRLDFPAPDGPLTTEIRPANALANASMPSPVLALVG